MIRWLGTVIRFHPFDSWIPGFSSSFLSASLPPFGFRRSLNCAAQLGIALAILVGAVHADDGSDFFEAKVRPVLAAHCYKCHTAARKGGLRLSSRASLLKGGKSGPAIVPGDPKKSLLIQVISRKHQRLKMPPKQPLAPRDVIALTRWVREGAVWPEETAEAADGKITQEQRDFWSFQPVKRPTVPRATDDRWNGNPVDAFVFSKLRAHQLTPGRPAEKRALIRRTTYDLTGLPATTSEVDSFLDDKSPGAFERVIDRLLAMRQYGERWGRHWLDIVRYADTAGDAGDYPVPEAYKYRNYVIDAFNSDKPYNEFIREQIAGDLLPFANEHERWEQIIATGYIAISRRIGVSPQNLKHITIENTIDNLGKTFLGLTLGCARCHDHKFDPIPTDDYYALYGIFESSVYPHAGAEHQPYRQDFVYRVGNKRADEILRPFREELAVWDRKERDKFAEYRSSQQRKPDDPSRTREVIWQELLELREQRRPFAERFPPLEIAYAIQEGDAHDARVHEAGDPRDPGRLVRRGFLQILGRRPLQDGHEGSGRRELAEWVTEEHNPLTARVAVNRIWHHHFGRGLVKTTSDFGLRGTPPTHPELLDFLASYFIEHGWSFKQMHRLIVLSQTYQLASTDVPDNSAIDPENDLLWRANRRRLDAEQIRDSLLTFSGRLDPTPGGRHPFGHRLTYFYRQHEPFAAEFPTRKRSVYIMQQRIQKNPYLDLFDGPDGNRPLPTRNATTTTLQALFLMNSKFIHQQAEVIAERLLDETHNTPSRVDWAYRTIFGRPPNADETARATKFLQTAGKQLAQARDKEQRQQLAWAGYIRGMISSNEFMFID
jgi:hypothetical protein